MSHMSGIPTMRLKTEEGGEQIILKTSSQSNGTISIAADYNALNPGAPKTEDALNGMNSDNLSQDNDDNSLDSETDDDENSLLMDDSDDEDDISDTLANSQEQ